MKKIIALAALAVLPAAANAELLASVEGFASFSEFDAGGNTEDSDGFGAVGSTCPAPACSPVPNISTKSWTAAQIMKKPASAAATAPA